MFDPDGPGSGGLFGLPPCTNPGVSILPVPVEVTTSFGGGCSRAPDAVAEASLQVELDDLDVGQPWRAGIVLDVVAPWLNTAHAELDADAARRGDRDALDAINVFGDRVARWVHDWTKTQLRAGRIPGVLGGDHSVPLGALQAATQHVSDLGVLHIDAHADLREAYEGFTHSHASIFHNALQLEGLTRLVQVGLRDVGAVEKARASADERVQWWTDSAMAASLHQGVPFSNLAHRIVGTLPHDVWVSLDVDGLDPALCPGTGTPVPGGLRWREVITLLDTLVASGRRVVGFDLVEVGGGAWDANVGARLLYKLAGFALASQQEQQR
jgi:agmatinase